MVKVKTPFKPVEPNINFPDKEKEILSGWNKKGIVKKYLIRNKNSKKVFSFLDGPMTANNPMGVHHAWGRTYKDLWQRYYNMKGYRQRFQNGFDAQGLWVEVEVEKELQFRSKKDIEEFGVAKFVQLCRDRVEKYSGIITEQSKRLGYFMDWDNSYFTLSDDNNYMIWHFLKVCADNGWIYKGNDSVPWCPRCETAISQHEMLTEDYKEVTHESVYLAFPLLGHDDEFLMVWTTTPWTIPANIAVAVDTGLEYSKVEIDGNKYWIAKEAVERVLSGEKYKVIKTVRGDRLVGMKYAGAFDDLPAVSSVSKKYNDKFHSVIATDNMLMPITTTEGTGLVHTAVSAGTEDFKLGKKLDLPMIPVIEDDARYMEGFGFLSGLNAKKHPELILDHLRKLDDEGRKFYFKVEKYTHRYPACWRCKTELVWKVTDEWYIGMDLPPKIKPVKSTGDDEESEDPEPQNLMTLRQRMLNVTGKINWIPGFGLDREIDWLTNMHDWLISKKNRYWGLALPIWECKSCGRFEVVGSKEELKDKAIEGWDLFKDKTPHKPYIDEVKLKCRGCGKSVSRIEPVGNPWLDAGIVAYSTVSSNNKACNFEPGKTKPLYLTDKEKWHEWIPADFITESFPGQFKNWFYALIAMSTVMENKEPFRSVLGFATLLAEDGRPMHKSWGNSIEFNEGADSMGVDVMRWMFVRQNPSDNMLFGYRNADETRRKFHLKLWNIYNFFVTYASLDEWEPGQATRQLNAPKSKSVLDQWILSRFNQTVGSVNLGLDKFDAYTPSSEIEKFVDDFSLWYIRRSRDRVGPAAESERDRNSFYQTTYYLLVKLSQVMAPFTPFISEAIYTNLTGEESVHLSEWPKIKALSGDEIGMLGHMQLVRNLTEKVHSQRKESQIPVRQPLTGLTVFTKPEESYPEWTKEILSSELNIKNIEYLEMGKAKNRKEFEKHLEKGFYLDTVITAELQEEAQARDLMRKIQSSRKEQGLDLTQKVDVENEWVPSDTKIINWLLKKAQVSTIKTGKFSVKASS